MNIHYFLVAPEEGDIWVKDVTNTTIKVDWESIQNANGYYISAQGQFTGDSKNENVGATTFTFTDLIPGECYVITVTGRGVSRGGSVQQRTCKCAVLIHIS